MDAQKGTVSIDLSFKQLTEALQRLPQREKIAIWRLLDQEIDRSTISQRFSAALQSIRSAHLDEGEDEVMIEVLQAQQEVRAARRNARP
jgi:hypothetical protein